MRGQGVERALEIRDGVLRTHSFAGAGLAVYVEGGELEVGLAGGRVLTERDFRARRLAGGRLRLEPREGTPPLALEVAYAADPSLPVLHKEVRVEAEGEAPEVAWIAVEALRCHARSTGGEAEGGRTAPPGRPVVLDGFLLAAVLHPEGRNLHDGRGRLRLVHSGEHGATARAVVLLAPPDTLQAEFFRFLEERRPPGREEAVRPAPGKPSPFHLLEAAFLDAHPPGPVPPDLSLPALRPVDRRLTGLDGAERQWLEETAGPFLPFARLVPPASSAPAEPHEEEDLAAFAETVLHRLVRGGLPAQRLEEELGSLARRPSEEALLEEALRWARREAEVLARAHPLAGLPRAGDLYGTTAALHDRLLLWVRNPTPNTRSFAIPLGAAFGAFGAPPREASAALLHPRRERLPLGQGTLRLTLGPFESALVEAGPSAALDPLTEGWPAHEPQPLLHVLAEGPARAVLRYEGAGRGRLELLVHTEVVHGTMPPPVVHRDRRRLELRPGPARGGVRAAALAAEPGQRYALRLARPEHGPFPGEAFFRLWVLAETPLPPAPAVPPEVPAGRFFPALPRQLAREGRLVVEDGVRRIPPPPPRLSAARRVADGAVFRMEVSGAPAPGPAGWVVTAGQRIAAIPGNDRLPPGAWEAVELPVEGEALVALELARKEGVVLTLGLEAAPGARFRVRRLQLALRFGPGAWLRAEPDPREHAPGEEGFSGPIVMGFR